MARIVCIYRCAAALFASAFAFIAGPLLRLVPEAFPPPTRAETERLGFAGRWAVERAAVSLALAKMRSYASRRLERLGGRRTASALGYGLQGSALRCAC